MEDEGLELKGLKAEVAALRATVDRLEARAVVGAVTQSTYPWTPEMLEATRAKLAVLGRYVPEDALIGAWLTLTGSPDAVLAGVEAVLSRHKEKAQHPAAPEPSDGATWLEAAAYFEFTDAHAGWSRVTAYLSSGELPPVSTSLDPERSVFIGLSKVKAAGDMAPIVPEVLRRAEEGISWAGHQATTGAELARLKTVLTAGPGTKGFLKEWEGFKDARLLRVAVLTGVLAGKKPTLGSYKMAVKPTSTLEDWLYAMWKTSRPWPASPAWEEGKV